MWVPCTYVTKFDFSPIHLFHVDLLLSLARRTLKGRANSSSPKTGTSSDFKPTVPHQGEKERADIFEWLLSFRPFMDQLGEKNVKMVFIFLTVLY